MDQRRGRLLLFAVAAAAAVLMYSSVASFPYLRADDTFIIRRNHFVQVRDFVGAYNLRYWHIVFANLLEQGRFFFWLSATGMSYLFDVFGLKSLMYLRAASLGLLAVFGYGLSRFLVAWKYSPVTAACLMALVLALPAFQLIMGNGFWLLLPLCGALLAASMMRRAVARPSFELRDYAGIALLVFAMLAMYQSVAFLFVGITAAALASSEWDARAGEITRYVLLSVALMAAATAAYTVAWILLAKFVIAGVYSIAGDGYSPQMVFHSLPANAVLFATRRVPQVLNLWYAPYISRTLAAWVAGVIGTIWLLDVTITPARRAAWRSTVLRLSLYALLFAVAESCMIVADKYNYFASRYTTSVVQSIILVFVLADAARRARALLTPLIRRDHMIYPAALLALTVICCVKAQTQTWSLIVLPSMLETRLVGTQIDDFLHTHHRLDEIEIIGRNTPPVSEQMLSDPGHAEKFGEYTFGNFQSLIYMHYLVRDVAYDITRKEPIRVLARMGDTTLDVTHAGLALQPDSGDFHLTIDTTQLTVYWRP